MTQPWPLVLGCIALAAPGLAQTVVSSSPVSGTWTSAGSPYIVQTTIAVEAGQTLTIRPGTEVRFAAGRSLQVSGTLNVQGTSATPVTLTADGTAAPGSWRQVLILNSGAVTMDYVQIRYAGGNGVPAVQIGNSTMLTGGLHASITNTTVSDAAGVGFGLSTDYSAKHTVLVQGCTVLRSGGGVRIGAAEQNDDIRILGNDFSAAGGTPVSAAAAALLAFGAGPERLSGNLPADAFGIAATDAFEDGTQIWNDVTVLPGDGPGPAVAADTVLQVHAGATMRFQPGQGLVVDGTLQATGTPEQPVTFSSLDPVSRGAWNGISFRPGSTGVLQSATVRGAGGASAGAVFVDGASVTLDGCRIEESSSHGLLYQNDGEARALSVKGSSFSGLDGACIRIDTVNPADTAIIQDNTFSVEPGISLPPAALTLFPAADRVRGNTGTDDLWLEGASAPDRAFPDGATLWYRAGSADDLAVRAGMTFTMAAGSRLRFADGRGMDVYGTLAVAGEPGAVVDIGGLSPAPGSTGGLRFHAGSSGTLASAVLRGAGYLGSPNLSVDGADVSGTGCAIVDGTGAGVALKGAATFSLRRSVVSGNAGPGIADASTGERVIGNAAGDGNDLSPNGGGPGPAHTAATAQTDSLAARFNYWGDPSGPAHATNPDGAGNRVTDHVDFADFAKAPLTLPLAVLNPLAARAGAIIAIAGYASSPLLDHWTLEYAPGDPPAADAYQPIFASRSTVAGGRLTDWDATGLDRWQRYTVRLTVTDVLGRTSQATAVTLSPAGDVNGDGRVGVADAVAVMRFITGRAVPDSTQRRAADVYPLAAPDGVLNTDDVRTVLRTAGGLSGGVQ